MNGRDDALQMVQTYLADCADRAVWGDPPTAELTEIICRCVERIGVDRRGPGQGGDARGPLEALHHALGYLAEQSDSARK